MLTGKYLISPHSTLGMYSEKKYELPQYECDGLKEISIVSISTGDRVFIIPVFTHHLSDIVTINTLMNQDILIKNYTISSEDHELMGSFTNNPDETIIDVISTFNSEDILDTELSYPYSDLGLLHLDKIIFKSLPQLYGKHVYYKQLSTLLMDQENQPPLTVYIVFECQYEREIYTR